MLKVIKNVFYQYGYQLLVMVLPLITVPYVSRVLGPNLVGTYSYTSTIVNYFVLLCMLGINAHGSRIIARAQSREERSREFSNLFSIHLFVSLFVFVAYVGYVSLAAEEYKIILLTQGFLLVASFLDISWLYFGLEEFKLTVTRNLVVKLVTVVAIFAFVKNGDDFLLYVFLMSFGTFAGQVALWPFVKRYVDFRRPQFRDSFLNLKPMGVLFVAVAATCIYHTIGKLFLGEMVDMSSVGYFEYADKVIQIPVAFITAFGTVMLPRMASLYADGKVDVARRYLGVSMEAMMYVAAALCFGIIAVRIEFVELFLGSGFAKTADLLLLMAPSILFIAISNVVRSQYIIPNDQDRVYVVAVLVAAILNVAMNATLIPIIGADGAAISSTCAYVAVFLVQLVPIRAELGIVRLFKPCIFPLVVGGIALFLANLLNYASIPAAVLVITKFCLFLAVFIILSAVSLRLQKRSLLRLEIKKGLASVGNRLKRERAK